MFSSIIAFKQTQTVPLTSSKSLPPTSAQLRFVRFFFNRNLTIQNILVSNSFNEDTQSGYPLGSTPKLAGRNDTIICKAGFICSQSALSSVTQTCDKGHYCLEGTLSSSNTTKECTAQTHCSNVLTKGKKSATKFIMTMDSNQLNTVTIATSSPNGNVVASPTYRSDGIPTASVATRSTNNLINGNMPNICTFKIENENVVNDALY